MSELRKLAKDEKLSRTKTVSPDGKSVTATFAVFHAGGEANYVLDDVRFDFSNCSQAEILELATARTIIATQARWKEAAKVSLKNTLQADQWKVIDVKTDIIDVERSRTSATPMQKATAAVAKMSDAERAELLAMLVAENNKSAPSGKQKKAA